jgi:hypothetical protein
MNRQNQLAVPRQNQFVVPRQNTHVSNLLEAFSATLPEDVPNDLVVTNVRDVKVRNSNLPAIANLKRRFVNPATKNEVVASFSNARGNINVVGTIEPILSKAQFNTNYGTTVHQFSVVESEFDLTQVTHFAEKFNQSASVRSLIEQVPNQHIEYDQAIYSRDGCMVIQSPNLAINSLNSQSAYFAHSQFDLATDQTLVPAMTDDEMNYVLQHSIIRPYIAQKAFQTANPPFNGYNEALTSRRLAYVALGAARMVCDDMDMSFAVFMTRLLTNPNLPLPSKVSFRRAIYEYGHYAVIMPQSIPLPGVRCESEINVPRTLMPIDEYRFWREKSDIRASMIITGDIQAKRSMKVATMPVDMTNYDLRVASVPIAENTDEEAEMEIESTIANFFVAVDGADVYQASTNLTILNRATQPTTYVLSARTKRFIRPRQSATNKALVYHSGAFIAGGHINRDRLLDALARNRSKKVSPGLIAYAFFLLSNGQFKDVSRILLVLFVNGNWSPNFLVAISANFQTWCQATLNNITRPNQPMNAGADQTAAIRYANRQRNLSELLINLKVDQEFIFPNGGAVDSASLISIRIREAHIDVDYTSRDAIDVNIENGHFYDVLASARVITPDGHFTANFIIEKTTTKFDGYKYLLPLAGMTQDQYMAARIAATRAAFRGDVVFNAIPMPDYAPRRFPEMPFDAEPEHRQPVAGGLMNGNRNNNGNNNNQVVRGAALEDGVGNNGNARAAQINNNAIQQAADVNVQREGGGGPGIRVDQRARAADLGAAPPAGPILGGEPAVNNIEGPQQANQRPADNNEQAGIAAMAEINDLADSVLNLLDVVDQAARYLQYQAVRDRAAVIIRNHPDVFRGDADHHLGFYGLTPAQQQMLVPDGDPALARRAPEDGALVVVPAPRQAVPAREEEGPGEGGQDERH